MTELKPCPFCGGEAKLKTWRDRWGNWNAIIYCINSNGKSKKERCQAEFFMCSDTKEKVIEEITSKWNTRPNPWHTGTPTEEGWYLIANKSYQIPYDIALWKCEQWTVAGWIAPNDIVKWQKIEEEELDG